MKKVIALVFLLGCIQFSFSQYKKFHKAEIHFNDGTIKNGEAKINVINVGSSLSTSKERLRFKSDNKKKIELIDANEIEKIIFHLDFTDRITGRKRKPSRVATFITLVKNKKKTKFGFAELIIDGKVKLVTREVSSSRSSTMSNITESLLVRDNQTPIPFNYLELKSFKKRAIAYFSDCPELISKIENKKYRKKDLKGIVTFYNDTCAK